MGFSTKPPNISGQNHHRHARKHTLRQCFSPGRHRLPGLSTLCVLFSGPRLPLLLFLLCIGFLTGLPQLSSAAQEKKSVLYLNSYHNGYQWSDGLQEGVRQVVTAGPYKVDLQIEYMDAKKFNYEAISKTLHRLYLEKFKDEHFDVIVISDNDALNFINRYRDELFPGVPVVFCGVNDLHPSDTAAGNITGVVELFDFMATVEIAKTLHPQRDHLVVLIDSSTAGTTIRKQIEKIVAENNTGLDIEYWIQLSLEEAQRRVRQLPTNAYLFIAPYYQVIDGRFYTSEEVSEAIYRHSNVPIYTAWEFMIGYGALGGKVLSSVEHGRMAGEMALKILAGTRADDIPIIREPGGINLFDYKVLEKLKVSMQLLPPDAKIINEPRAFYSLSRELFWTIMISFILLVIALVVMIGTMLEKRKVQQKISDQLAFQETLMDTIPQLVSWKDAAGTYLGANQAFINFFGITNANRVIGRTTSDIVADESFSRWSVQSDNEVVRRGRPFRKVRRKVETMEGGGQGWLEVNKVALRGQGGRIVGILSTAENITKEQMLEKQLIQSQKMEAIGTLAGGIAHDFNNILTSIINSTELALMDVPQESRTERDLQRVLKASSRGASLVQQILSFCRPSKEGFLPTELDQIISEVIHLMEATMPANIEVRYLTEPEQPDRPFLVFADPTQLHQAILNLCTNAYHALREHGGVMTITLSRIPGMSGISAISTISAISGLEGPGDSNGSSAAGTSNEVTAQSGQGDQSGRIDTPSQPHTAGQGAIRIRVMDNGPGIPPAIIDKIFDPFFSTKSKSEGTGLGLAVVHGIVKGHHGTIRVQNNQNGNSGCTFEIVLPECSLNETQQPEVRKNAVISGGHLLFVEDDEDQLETTPRLLSDLGFTVRAVADSRAALTLTTVEQQEFDLLITDFDLPGLSGAELAARIPQLPAILVSGREDARVAAQKVENIRRVIIKPYTQSDLATAISEVLADQNNSDNQAV